MGILDDILASKREEVAQARRALSIEALRDRARAASAARGFAESIRNGRADTEPCAGDAPPRVVAEIKRASPSAGLIREDFDPAALARGYAAHGAAAISCLTDARWFRGSLDHLRAARAAVDVPVLRKDFLMDPWQVWEARAAGADAVLLIAGFVEWATLAELRETAREACLDVLLEIHTDDELAPALDLAPDVLGINNRDLRGGALTTDLAVTERLAPSVPTETTLISESGIRTPDDVARLGRVGVDGFLIGERLMRRSDPGAALTELMRGGATP